MNQKMMTTAGKKQMNNNHTTKTIHTTSQQQQQRNNHLTPIHFYKNCTLLRFCFFSNNNELFNTPDWWLRCINTNRKIHRTRQPLYGIMDDHTIIQKFDNMVVVAVSVEHTIYYHSQNNSNNKAMKTNGVVMNELPP
jgi:hypothetical protein